MEQKDFKKTRRVILRITIEEFIKLERGRKASTCRSLSEYVRLILFEKPIVTRYRNQSLDDLMAELIDLKKELGRLGNNFNQAVRRLNSIDKISEIRGWLLAYDDDKNQLHKAIESIKMDIQKIAEKWLQ